MDTAFGTLVKGSEEERRAGGGFEAQGFAEVGPRRVVHDEEVRGLDEFFLDA